MRNREDVERSRGRTGGGDTIEEYWERCAKEGKGKEDELSETQRGIEEGLR